jgi:hypothetical protein
VRTLALVALTATAITLAGCKKTGEGEYEVERPTVGTTTDTVRTPTVDLGTTTDTLVVKRPTVGTTSDTVAVKRPTVNVKP